MVTASRCKPLVMSPSGLDCDFAPSFGNVRSWAKRAVPPVGSSVRFCDTAMVYSTADMRREAAICHPPAKCPLRVGVATRLDGAVR